MVVVQNTTGALLNKGRVEETAVVDELELKAVVVVV